MILYPSSGWSLRIPLSDLPCSSIVQMCTQFQKIAPMPTSKTNAQSKPMPWPITPELETTIVYLISRKFYKFYSIFLRHWCFFNCIGFYTRVISKHSLNFNENAKKCGPIVGLFL